MKGWFIYDVLDYYYFFDSIHIRFSLVFTCTRRHKSLQKMIDFLDLSFACKKCNSGHRTLTCTHTTSTQLTEIKQKGRPLSQCTSCRTTRSNKAKKASHHQCLCGDEAESRKQKFELFFLGGLSLVISLDLRAVSDLQAKIDSDGGKAIVFVKSKNDITKAFDIVEEVSLQYTRTEIIEDLSAQSLERMIGNK